MADLDERALEISFFRYRIIAEAVEGKGKDKGEAEKGISEALSEAAEREYDFGGQPVRFSVRTLWRWYSAHRRGGLRALGPKARKDKQTLRAFKPEVLEAAKTLRQEKRTWPTKTVIDILVRKKVVAPKELSRSTLDRHLDRAGLSRYLLKSLGVKTFKKILTTSPMELVVVDFHHGPYVRVGHEPTLRRALLCAFIDHFSRYVLDGRYYLHEDFAALRFGFRRLLTVHGLITRLYLDNGAAFQSLRFHAACDSLGIELIHSKPYVSEGRGVVERFNRTLKEQFEDEARGREEPLSLDELNAFFEAWLAERYHKDKHSETNEPPFERFSKAAQFKAAPELGQIDEFLRLREKRIVHKKWSTVEVFGKRYFVDGLRGRKVHVLYDSFDPAYVLIVHDGRVVQRAFPHKAGQLPPAESKQPSASGPQTDYLALLRADYESRTQAELASLRLRAHSSAPELSLLDFFALFERCRGKALTPTEQAEVSALFRKLRPFEPDFVRIGLEGISRRLGTGLHVRMYLDALQSHLVHQRSKTEGKKP